MGRNKELRKKYITSKSFCILCGSLENLEIDHIIPLMKGGNNDKKNIQILCANCHLKKTTYIDWKISPIEYIPLRKKVMPFGNSGAHIIMPSKYIGKEIIVLLKENSPNWNDIIMKIKNLNEANYIHNKRSD